MSASRAWRTVALSLLVAAWSGCAPALPENVGDPESPWKWSAATVGAASFYSVVDVAGAQWLEIPDPAGGAPIGGYLSDNAPLNGALVVLLDGAAGFDELGPLGLARDFHKTWGGELRRAGYRTWTLVLTECGTPYGGRDVEQLIAALDWLAADGLTLLGAERVFVVGYSVGATTAIIANRERRVAAVAALSGLTGAEQFLAGRAFYEWIASIYPHNEALCQLGDTFRAYDAGAYGGWSNLDSTRDVTRFRSPMFIAHGRTDSIYFVSHAEELQAAHQAARAAGLEVPPMEFVYVGGDHFATVNDPTLPGRVIGFFEPYLAPRE